jgi:RecB family endonuclease NucS
VKILGKTFPFRDIFTQFLKEYSECTTYWYAPKWRVLNDDNIKVTAQILKVIFNNFIEDVWNVETQDKILTRLKKLKIFSPYKKSSKKTDRSALTRICKKLLETLGLLWVQNGKEIVITDAGLDLLSAQSKERRYIIERQIIKYQYPNPSLSGACAEGFRGLLPHVFLLQILRECENRITKIEFELFVNLAKSQEDLDRIVKYINFWREINEHDKQIVLNEARKIIIPGEKQTRFKRIKQDASYQKPFFAFPNYLEVDKGDIICREPDKVNNLLDKLLRSFKITIFTTPEDWFAYYGDPRKKPSWSTYLITMIENAAKTEEVEQTVKTVMEEYKEALTPEETEDIKRAQVEKDIETFYFAHPEKLEKGLVVNRRQFPTPIGRIDLLCKSKEDEYVVVEIKADEARDSVFGQILRYIGWFHRNVPKAKNNVRGIILAFRFPETAHYSRIGLLKPDYKKFIQFHECKL